MSLYSHHSRPDSLWPRAASFPGAIGSTVSDMANTPHAPMSTPHSRTRLICAMLCRDTVVKATGNRKDWPINSIVRHTWDNTFSLSALPFLLPHEARDKPRSQVLSRGSYMYQEPGNEARETPTTSCSKPVFSQEICLRGVHNEIHSIRKPCEALPAKYFKLLQKHKGHTRAQCPSEKA